jgi:AcrR family transcriptional regulator/DNA-binding MarR family transcriptional regulator
VERIGDVGGHGEIGVADELGSIAGRRPVGSSGRLGALSVRPDGVDLARADVPEIQRARILAALVEVARERGAGRVTVAHIVARSGVSRRTFYEMFEDREACFLAAFQDGVQRTAVGVVSPFRSEGLAWQVRVRAGLLGLLEFLDDEPGLGGLCVVDALGAGPSVLAARARVVALLVDAIDEGRELAKASLTPSPMTAEAVVGGVLAVLYARLVAGRSAQSSGSRSNGHRAVASKRPKPVVGLLSTLMSMIVLPYLGPAAAARETMRPVPKARRRPAQPRSNPLEGLDMRLTYRTVRVLVAIADEPDASNRQVAEAAGVHDQGQISKLLARLEHLGLVENGGAGSARGGSNAWRLTARGRDVERTIHRQSTPAGA